MLKKKKPNMHLIASRLITKSHSDNLLVSWWLLHLCVSFPGNVNVHVINVQKMYHRVTRKVQFSTFFPECVL